MEKTEKMEWTPGSIIVSRQMAELMDEAKKIHKELKKTVKNFRVSTENPWTTACNDYFRKMEKHQIIWPKKNGSYEMQWLRTLADANIFIVKGGWLQIPRWKNNKKTQILFEGIDSAYRAQDHILDQYRKEKKGEITEIKSLQDITNKINLFLVNWMRMKDTGKEKEMIDLIFHVVSALESCQDFFKVNAHNQIEEVSFLQDNLQRENPSALATRTIAALNDLNNRLLKIESIIPKIAFRKQIIALEIRRLQARIEKAKNKINFILRIKPMKGAENVYINEVVKYIKETEKNLTTIWISPFRERKIQACDELVKAKKIIGYDLAQAKIHLEKTGEILQDEKIKLI